MMHALEERGFELVPLGPLQSRWRNTGKILRRVSGRLFGKRFPYMYCPVVTRELGKIVEEKVMEYRCQAVFVPGAGSLVSRARIDVPIVAYSDATLKGLIGYYPRYSNMWGWSEKWALDTDMRMINKSYHVIYASQWGADSAVSDYGCERDKVSVVPFGANVDSVPDRDDILKIRANSNDTCRLLFVGVDWYRKGGEIAYRVMLELNERGIDTELVVCGCLPPVSMQHPKLTTVGFLDKNNREQVEQLSGLFRDASFFILPSRSECSAVVLCEAAAFALPRIATRTGGIPSYIRDGKDGYTIPQDEDHLKYADAIQSTWNDKDKYYSLCRNSRDRFERELNWNSWSVKVSKILLQAVAG